MKAQKSDSKNLLFLNKIIIAALFLGAAIFFYGCENDLEKIKAFTNTQTLPKVEARNFETLFTDSGEVRFFMKTPKLLQFENEGREFYEFPEGIELVKYDKNKQIISSITADYAKRFLSEDQWEAKNNVVATNFSGDTLKTEHLIWDEKEERIYTEEFVTIIRPDQIITGIGFESDQSLQEWKIKKPKGTIYVTLDKNSNNKQDSIPAVQNENKPVQTFNKPLEFSKK